MYGSRNTMLPIAGPGQSPPMPHPMPNNADPTMSLLSMIPFFTQGKCHFSAKCGVSFLDNKKCQITDTVTAPIITKRSVGSHFPVISRNPRTRSGEVISESTRANPKRMPATREMRLVVLDIVFRRRSEWYILRSCHSRRIRESRWETWERDDRYRKQRAHSCIHLPCWYRLRRVSPRWWRWYMTDSYWPYDIRGRPDYRVRRRVAARWGNSISSIRLLWPCQGLISIYQRHPSRARSLLQKEVPRVQWELHRWELRYREDSWYKVMDSR